MPDPKRRDELGPEALRALEDFGYFRLRYFGRIAVPWQEEAAEQVLEWLASPDKEFVVINVPPGSGKSTLFVHDIPAWLTCRDRSIRGLIGSRTARQAEVYTARLRRSFERLTPVKAKDEELARGLAVDGVGVLALDFGRFKPVNADQFTREQFYVAQLDDEDVAEKEPTWTAFGQDSGSLGWRVNIALWDDLVDKTVIRTVEATENQQEWWDDEGETRIEPGGAGILNGQRMSPNDLYRYNLNKTIADDEDEDADPSLLPRKYRHVIYKAHYEDRCRGAETHGRDAPPWPEGCLLDPKRLPWKELRAHKSNNRKYEIVYQQQDVDDSDVLVPKSWVDGGRWRDDDGTEIDLPGCWDKHRGLAEIPAGLTKPWLSIATADPSPTKFWSIQWWLYHPATEQRFLLDLIRQSMDAPDFLDWDHSSGSFVGVLEEWQKRSVKLGAPITRWVVEKNAAQRFLLQYDHVRRWQATHGVDITGHETHVNKSDEKFGIQTIAPHYKYGRIRLPGKVGDLGRVAALKLVDEVTRWPDGSTDDCVMAHWFLEWNLPRLKRRQRERRSGPADPRRPAYLPPVA